MSKIPSEIRRNFKKYRGSSRFLCHAPWVSLKISMDGLVSPCCYNISLNDYYSAKSLNSIWDGEIFNQYRTDIKDNILPHACEKCEKAILNKEFSSVKIHQYDGFKIKRFVKAKPQLIELALSNTCNLECIMCSGANSSSIRKNREKLPPIPTLFDSNFRKEFYELIPSLKEVVFAGGEPFLIDVYYDLWEDIMHLNPSCKMSIVTNGTVLNEKIKAVLNRGRFKINLSFDAISKETYEKIRINADFDKTLSNLKYFAELSKSKGNRLHIPVCPLRQNRFEIPDLVRFCNDNDYSLNFVSVFRDINNAMWGMSSEELSELINFYTNQKFDYKDVNSRKNIAQFNDLIMRIEKWKVKAEVRENFYEIFDLGKDSVQSLSIELLNAFESGVNKMFSSDNTKTKNLELVRNKFEELMLSLPDYYNSNHFYKRLLSNSDVLITQVLLNHSIESIKDIAGEIFFYSEEDFE